MNPDIIFLLVVTLLTLAVFGIDVSQKRRQ
jgi:Tfp pilus assembly protein PilX